MTGRPRSPAGVAKATTVYPCCVITVQLGSTALQRQVAWAGSKVPGTAAATLIQFTDQLQ
jgi:hypothetical protein